MNRFFSAPLAILLATSASAAEPEQISLPTLVERARRNDPEIAQILHQRAQTSFLKDLSLPAPVLAVDSTTRVGFALNSGNRTTALTLGLSKVFPSTGTEVEASFNFNEQVDRQERVLTVQAVQPLYRNAFGRQTRDLIARLDKENEALHLETAEALEDYIAVLVTSYLDWQLAHLSLAAATQLHKESLELERTIEARRRRGVAAAVDVERVILETLTRQQTVLERQMQLDTLTAEIARVLGDPRNVDLVPDPAPIAFALDFDQTPRPETPRTLLALQRTLEAGTLDIAILSQDLDPSLNFVAGLRNDQSTRFTTDIDRQEAFVGLELQWPFMDSQAKARIRRAKYDRTTTELAIKSFQEALAATTQAQRRRIEMQRKRAEVSKARREAATRVVEAEQLRYRRGQVQLETLIQARQAQAESEFAYLATGVELSKAVVEWLRLVDLLLVNDDEVRLPRP